MKTRDTNERLTHPTCISKGRAWPERDDIDTDGGVLGMHDRISPDWWPSRFIVLAGGIVLAICVFTVEATTVLPLTDRHLVARSQNIIEGTVTKLTSKWNVGRTQIHTVIEVTVRRALKGDLQPGQQISLRMLGGTVGDTTLLVVDAPLFRANEHLLLFLTPDFENQLSPIVGFDQGKFSVTADPVTRKLMIKPRHVPLDEFVRRVTQIVKAQTPKEAAHDSD
jgi:hypothetical protein